jgi:uncharacterized membrane protein (UPF0136 family)
MSLHVWPGKLLSGIVIIICGFILFNIAFMTAAFIMNTTNRILGLGENAAPHIIGALIFLLVLAVLSWLVYRSKQNKLIKATALTVPLMVLLTIVGMQLYEQPKWVPFLLGGAIVTGLSYYLYKMKSPWEYYFAVICVSIIGIVIMFRPA